MATKKFTKKQKAELPAYIVRIDMSYFGNKIYEDVKGYNRGYYVKAMEEKDILAAMKRLDKVIAEHGHEFYLLDIIGKTDRENEDGRPIYENKIRCRISLSDWEDEDGNKKALPAKWHFCDNAHNESDDYEYLWYPDEDRYGYLEYIKKGAA